MIALAVLPRTRRSALVRGTAFPTPVWRKGERSKLSTVSVWAGQCPSLPRSRGDAIEGSWPSGGRTSAGHCHQEWPGTGLRLCTCVPLCPTVSPSVSLPVSTCVPPCPALSPRPCPAQPRLSPGIAAPGGPDGAVLAENHNCQPQEIRVIMGLDNKTLLPCRGKAPNLEISRGMKLKKS